MIFGEEQHGLIIVHHSAIACVDSPIIDYISAADRAAALSAASLLFVDEWEN